MELRREDLVREKKDFELDIKALQKVERDIQKVYTHRLQMIDQSAKALIGTSFPPRLSLLFHYLSLLYMTTVLS